MGEPLQVQWLQCRYGSPDITSCPSHPAPPLVMISYNDRTILAGTGTIGLEIVEQMKEMDIAMDAVIVPMGGGGLIAGISLAVKSLSPSTLVIVRWDASGCAVCVGRWRTCVGNLCCFMLAAGSGVRSVSLLH